MGMKNISASEKGTSLTATTLIEVRRVDGVDDPGRSAGRPGLVLLRPARAISTNTDPCRCVYRDGVPVAKRPIVIEKMFRYVAIATACLVVMALLSALSYRKYLQHKVAEARAIHSSNGIDRLEALRIGGLAQWSQVRGENINNPILLFIHGGPGAAFIPLSGSFQRPWEKHFTVVQWDQRGEGSLS
jgi:hypothetical protein